MGLSKLLLGVGEVLGLVVLVMLTLTLSYRLFARLLLGIDADKEIREGNRAAAVLLLAIMGTPTMILLRTLTPVLLAVRSFVLGAGRERVGVVELGAYGLGYVVFVLALSLVAMWIAVKVFDRLTPGFVTDDEIRRGNIAAGIVMAAVILIVALFMQEGIAALTRSLVPEPSLGELKVLQ